MATPSTQIPELAQAARDAGRLGIDTEFVSERRYRPLLCLVQVVVEERIEVIDPLEPIDAAPLAEVLADPDIEIVMHAGRQDVALLKRTWDTDVRGVFDTQIAAGFAGYGAQAGYDALTRAVLGVSSKGAEGFSRWDRRPLTEQQVEYARADVEHLLPMTDGLKEKLKESGRLEWAYEECRILEQANDDRDGDHLFGRLPRVRRLGKKQQSVARHLIDWREEIAERIDRPASSVLPDHVLVEAARRRPDSKRGLEEVRGIPGQTVQRWGKELLTAIADADAAPPPPELPSSEPGDPSDAPLIALGQALVRQRAIDAGVATDLVTTQSDVAAIVSSLRRNRDEPGIRTLTGWRRELVGDELLALLRGERVVRIADGRLSVEER